MTTKDLALVISRKKYLGAGYEKEVLWSRRVEEGHFPLSFVVGSNLKKANRTGCFKTTAKENCSKITSSTLSIYLKGKNVEPLQSRRHAQHFLSMVRIIEISLLDRMTHTSRVPTNYVKVGPCIDPSFRMPLHLSGARIVHRRGEYGYHRRLWIEHTVLKNLKTHYKI